MTASRNWCWLFWSVALSVIALDLGSKAWVSFVLPPGQMRSFWAGTLRVYHLPEVNQGAFLAIGNHWGPIANSLFAVVSGLVIVVILVVHARSSVRQSALLSAALGSIFGGALGNLYDRLRFGGVRDFVQLFVPVSSSDSIPVTAVFNLADTALLIGASLLVIVSCCATPACSDSTQS